MSKNDRAQTDPVQEPDREPMAEAVRDAEVDESIESDEQAPPQSITPADAFAPPVDEVEQLKIELREAKDRELRGRAELENYRKRAARQMEDERRYANVPLLRDILPIWDNIGRAIEAAEQTHDTASLLEGVKIVAGQLESVFQRHHCVEIEAVGNPFDPNLHEAISQQPTDEHPPNTAVFQTQVGFQLHDRVVRPAQVIVSTALPKPVVEETEEGGEQE